MQEPEEEHKQRVIAYARRPGDNSEWVCLLQCGHIAYVCCRFQSQVPKAISCSECKAASETMPEHEQNLIAYMKTGRGRHRWLGLLSCGHTVYFIARSYAELPLTYLCPRCKSESQ